MVRLFESKDSSSLTAVWGIWWFGGLEFESLVRMESFRGGNPADGPKTKYGFLSCFIHPNWCRYFYFLHEQ